MTFLGAFTLIFALSFQTATYAGGIKPCLAVMDKLSLYSGQKLLNLILEDSVGEIFDIRHYPAEKKIRTQWTLAVLNHEESFKITFIYNGLTGQRRIVDVQIATPKDKESYYAAIEQRHGAEARALIANSHK